MAPVAKKAYKVVEQLITWKVFEQELWARFRPINYQNLDKALSHIKQSGSL